MLIICRFKPVGSQQWAVGNKYKQPNAKRLLAVVETRHCLVSGNTETQIQDRAMPCLYNEITVHRKKARGRHTGAQGATEQPHIVLTVFCISIVFSFTFHLSLSRMNYIEQINLLHMVRDRDNIDTFAVTFYVILLHKCNRANWQNPITVKNTLLQSELGVTYKVLCATRNRLKQSGLVRFECKVGKPLTTYTLLTFDEMIAARALLYKNGVTDELVNELRDELRDELRAELQDELRDEVCATSTKGIKNKTETKQNKTIEILAEDKPRPSTKKNDKEIIQTPDTEQPIQNSKVVSPGGVEAPTTLFVTCRQMYIDWFTARYGISPRIDGVQGNGLHNLLKYFRAQLPADTPTDESREAIESAFKLVLDGWDRLDDFTQKQTKLVQLASNIQNIIVQLKTQSTHANTKKQQAGPGYVPIWRR